MQQHGTGSGLTIRVDPPGHSPAGNSAAERSPLWFGDAGSNAGLRPHPVQIIGSAHGPKLLELLRAS